MAKTSKKSLIDKNRVLNPGIYVSGGAVEQSDWDTTDPRTRMQDYANMRNDDCIASTAIELLTKPIQNSVLKIKPAILNQADEPTPIAQEAADYVAWIYDNLEIGLDNYIRHKLLALPFGVAAFERVWKRGETYQGKVTNRLVDLSPIQPDTIFRFKYSEKAVLEGVEFYNRIPEHGERIITLESEYLHLWSPFSEFGNPWGRSMLMPARVLYKIKSQIWRASGRASTRGAGIPEFILTPTGNKTDDAALKAALSNIAKSIGNSENAYVVSQKDRAEFKLHTLQNQEMNIPLIQQANREMFYNTMTEFVTAGIGENGSRAATSEHKGPYYEAIAAISRNFEWNEYFNIEKIIEQSPYYGLIDESEYPTVCLERAKDADVALVLSALGSITKTPEDEVFIRNILGLPEISLEKLEEIKEQNRPVMIPTPPPEVEEPEVPEEIKAEEVVEEVEEEEPEELKAPVEEKESAKNAHTECPHCLAVEPKPDTVVVHDNIFELKSATETLASTKERAEAVIDEVIKKAVEDVAMKLERNPKKRPALAFKKELIDRLESIFNGGFEKGAVDIRKEYGKLGRMELAVTPIKIVGSKGKLEAKVDTLYGALEASIRDELELLNQRNIENAGGMTEYIMGRFGDTQKKIKSDLSAIASGGYVAGRNEEMTEIELKDPEVARRYETSLEALDRLCEVCAPYAGMIFDRPQAEYVGLNWEGDPVNPLCLGGGHCRCTWVPAFTGPTQRGE